MKNWKQFWSLNIIVLLRIIIVHNININKVKNCRIRQNVYFYQLYASRGLASCLRIASPLHTQWPSYGLLLMTRGSNNIFNKKKHCTTALLWVAAIKVCYFKSKTWYITTIIGIYKQLIREQTQSRCLKLNRCPMTKRSRASWQMPNI